MTSNKKLVVTISVLAITILLALGAIVAILVATTQSAGSNVKVRFKATDVAVTMKATAYAGGNTYTFREGGASAGNNYISLTPDNNTGELSFVESEGEDGYIILDKNNKTIVFEYEFQNDIDTVDVEIDSAGVPSINQDDNLAISYAYSDTKLDDPFSLQEEAESTYTHQLLPGYVGEVTKKYIYVYATISDHKKDALLDGSFDWNMGRPGEGEVATYTLNTAGAELVERTSTGYSTTTVSETMEYKTWATTTGEIDIDVYPADLGANNLGTAFVGWSTTPNATEAEAISAPALYYADGVVSNAIEATSKTVYPVFKESTVPDSSIEWDSSTSSYKILATAISTEVTEFFFPDIYQKGSNPVAKVTTMADGSGILGENLTVNSVWLGRYLTNIGNNSFYDCYAINSVKISDKVTTIGYGAFTTCRSLNSVTIPNSVTSIGSYAFGYCISLNSITIPNSVTSIGDHAFLNCSGLTSVTIGTGVTSIGSYAFYGCSELTRVDYLGTIKQWCSISFAGNSSNPTYNAKDLHIQGELLTSIESEDLKGVTSIGDNAFFACTSLAKLVVANSVVSIGSFAFHRCTAMTSATIPSSVTSFGNGAFDSCSGLTRVDYFGTMKQWCNIDFDGNGANPNNEAKNLYINGVLQTTISNSDLEGLTTINGAFAGMEFITSLTLPNTVTTIETGAFYGCSNLNTIVIPNTVTSIGNFAFYKCTSLTNVTLSNNLTSIGKSAFSNCSSLASITISSSVTTIDSRAFSSCTNLSSVTFDGATETTTWDAGGTSVSVTDPSVNATNLKSTYSTKTWTRTAV